MVKWHPKIYAYASDKVIPVWIYGLEVEYAPWYHMYSGSCAPPRPRIHLGVPVSMWLTSWYPTFCTTPESLVPPVKPCVQYPCASMVLGFPN